MWDRWALLLCPLPVLFCGPPPFPSSENQLVVGWMDQAQLRVGQHLQRGLFVQLLWPTTCHPSPNPAEFRLALGDSGNRAISQGDGAVEPLVGAAGQWKDSIPGSSSRPLTLATPGAHTEWGLSRGQMEDRAEHHSPHPLTLLSYHPGCSPPSVRPTAGQRSHDPGCLVLRPPFFFPSNQINKASSVLHAPLPPASPSPHPCHEVTGRHCQEAGWPLLGLAALLVSASLALILFPASFLPLSLFSFLPFCPLLFQAMWACSVPVP